MSENRPLVRPFAGLRPASGRAKDVLAPPYDVVNESEARALAAGKPESFLHVSRAEIDLPEGTDPHDQMVYTKAAENLNRMIDEGVLIRDDAPCYYIYRLRMDDHVQTGIVGGGSIAAYDANRIRRHELTRPDKEDDRVRQIEMLNAQTGPVMVTHRKDRRIADVIAKVVKGDPACDVVADRGVEHTIWVVDQAQDIAELNAAFDAMEAIYIADGHHRSASASRVAASRRADTNMASRRAGTDQASGHASSATTDWQNQDYFLLVSFPDDEVQIFDYNRIVRDLNGLSKDQFIERVSENFRVEPSNQPAKPTSVRTFGMYLGRQWYRLTLRQSVSTDHPVASLDISLLTDRLLTPILDIGDPRTDTRIEFVGGIRGMEALERRVDSGDMAVAFALYPTSLTELMAVADADRVMPPKSTWFEPKLADGLVSLVLD